MEIRIEFMNYKEIKNENGLKHEINARYRRELRNPCLLEKVAIHCRKLETRTREVAVGVPTFSIFAIKLDHSLQNPSRNSSVEVSKSLIDLSPKKISSHCFFNFTY